MTKRKAISAKTRFDIFKRDAFICQYCGSHPPTVILHVDHINPVAKGGFNDHDNLVTSCSACNMGKGPRELSDIPASLSSRAAETSEREAQILGFSAIMEAKRERIETDCWRVANIFIEAHGKTGVSRDYFHSIKRFVEGLGVHLCMEAMEAAVARIPRNQANCFRYFCGMCWRKMREQAE